MKKISFCVCILFVSLLITIGCKHRSYGSSHQMSEEDDSHFDFIAQGQNPDCVAWKFYLYTSMYDIVHQGSVRIVVDMKLKYLDRSNSVGGSVIDMYKVLPPETAKLIIDTIIEKEGSHCSREVLYEIPSCIFRSDLATGKRLRGGGTSYAKGHQVDIEYDHFSKSTGLPISDELRKKYSGFLEKHISNSPNTKATPAVITMPYSVSYAGEHAFMTYYDNSFGVCMLEKYKKHFKDQNIFDIAHFYPWDQNDYEAKLDPASVEIFIRESDKISEKYRESAP